MHLIFAGGNCSCCEPSSKGHEVTEYMHQGRIQSADASFWGEFEIFLKCWTTTEMAVTTHFQVAEDVTEMPSRTQFLRFLVERVLGGEPRLFGIK